MLRIAPDDAIVAGAATLTLDDPFAIIEPEYAFVHWRLTPRRVRATSPITSNGRFPQPASSVKA